MPTAASSTTADAAKPGMPGMPVKLRRVGCVSFLNAKPLIDGFPAADDRAEVHFDVPSGLLDDLQQRRVDIALCPVIDYYRSAVPLEVVPVGAIGCDGPTLTVKLFSRVPVERIETVHADTDSHTSVALLQVILAERFGRRPGIVSFNPHGPSAAPQAMLLIGDKVVTDAPDAAAYPHQMDLGQGWRELTELPFVFAVWMARWGEPLDNVPAALDTRRRANSARLAEIAAFHAPRHGWPVDLARRYFTELLTYEFGPAQVQAVERFAAMLHRHGLIDVPRPLNLRRLAPPNP